MDGAPLPLRSLPLLSPLRSHGCGTTGRPAAAVVLAPAVESPLLLLPLLLLASQPLASVPPLAACCRAAASEAASAFVPAVLPSVWTPCVIGVAAPLEAARGASQLPVPTAGLFPRGMLRRGWRCSDAWADSRHRCLPPQPGCSTAHCVSNDSKSATAACTDLNLAIE